MRTDRLISIIMLLQIHKKLTASELSERLEVSIRTIYRDIDALSSIGVPIFADRGANGGINLLGDYKTSLTGINNDELLSLFIPTGDKILEDLGIGNLKDSTMLKLLGNSSPNQMKEIENIQNYFYIDMYAWNDTATSVNISILSTLQNAIWNSRSIKILYRKINETKEIVLNPLGLVCKRGVWYLAAVDQKVVKIYKVVSIESAFLMNDNFDRPSDFNLKDFWKSSTSNFKSLIPKFTFIFKINSSILNHIKERQFITISETIIKENEIYLNIKFDAMWQGIEFAFTYGKDIKIIEPIEAITEIKKKSLEVLDLY